MKNLRLLLVLTSLCALAATGCIIISGQIFAHFKLPPTFTISDTGTEVERVAVDLNTIDEYEEHKDKIKGLSDVALVGKFTNLGGQAGGVEVWITPGATSLADVAAVRAGATKLWGPGMLPAGVGAVRTIGWDESAKLLTAAGKKMLIDEAKGDGQFTLYTFGTAGTYNIKVDGGALILTISAGM